MNSAIVTFTIVILSEAGNSRSEFCAESKDPYSMLCARRLELLSSYGYAAHLQSNRSRKRVGVLRLDRISPRRGDPISLRMTSFSRVPTRTTMGGARP